MFRTPSIILIFLLSIALAGCSVKSAKLTGPLLLTPMSIESEWYSVRLNEGIFINDSVRVSVYPVNDKDKIEARFIKDLISANYIVMIMGIENKMSDKKIYYNPSLTTLRSSRIDYKKPLDFTRLFEVAVKFNAESSLNRGLKGKFYDTNAIIRPGETISKLLIFTPFTERSRKVRLTLQEIYLGPDTLNLNFPLERKALKTKDKKRR